MNPRNDLTPKKPLLPTLSACLLALAMLPAGAQEKNVTSGSGGRVVSGAGGCVQSIGGTQDLCVEDSDGDGVLDNIDKCPNTPKGAKVDADGCMLKLVLNNIHFDVDKAELKDEAKAILDPIIEVLKGRPDIKGLTITGHTDADGSEKHNQKLSEARAQAVADYLKTRGVGVEITAKGMGESSPVADNKTPEGKAQNRRIEIGVVK